MKTHLYSKLGTFIFLLLSNFSFSQGTDLDQLKKNYDSYRVSAFEWINDDILNSPNEILIELPVDRTKTGLLRLVTPLDYEYPPIKCLARNLAKNHELKEVFNNEAVKKNLSTFYNDIPTGDYFGFVLDTKIAKAAFPTLSSSKIIESGIIVFVPMNNNSELGYIIHGAPLVNGDIPPGYGSVVIAQEEMSLLVERAHYANAGIAGQDISVIRNKFSQESDWTKLDAYFKFFYVTIKERKPTLTERIGLGKGFNSKGFNIENDDLVDYDSGYMHPLPISNFKMVKEYYKMLAIGNEILFQKILDEMSIIENTFESYFKRQITGEKHIELINQSLLKIQSNTEKMEKLENVKSSAEWIEYIDKIYNYIKYLANYTSDWTNPDTIGSPEGRHDCELVDTKCDILVLKCQYECFGGERYSEACGVCFIVAF